MHTATGAMMTEIGLAQQRLFDDDGSIAGHNHSMSTTYPSGISEPCSFPMHYDHQDPNGTSKIPGPPNVPREPTQLVAPQPVNGYEYSTPAGETETHVETLLRNEEQVTADAPSKDIDETGQAKPQNSAQRSKCMHTEWASPHDTEPNSSVRSPQLNRSKIDHDQKEMTPPRSPVSTHDELSAPAETIHIAPPDIASIVKKRGRPKKQPVQLDDEDDELSMFHEPEFLQETNEKRRPGRPPKSEKPEPKKRGVKRSKTAPDTLQKSNKMIEDDDDVIWVESRQLEVENGNGNTKPMNGNDSNPKSPKQTSPEVKEQPAMDEKVKDPAPAPKKRGRKRKQTAEQTTEQAAEQAAEQTAEAPPTSKEVQSEINQDKIDTEAKELPILDPPKDDKQEETPMAKEPQLNQPAKQSTVDTLPQTPQISKARKTHSPISSTSKVPYRIGLSKKARIAPLLKVVRK